MSTICADRLRFTINLPGIQGKAKDKLSFAVIWNLEFEAVFLPAVLGESRVDVLHQRVPLLFRVLKKANKKRSAVTLETIKLNFFSIL